MKSFNYHGKEYRSLQGCCAECGVSYQKVRRLCRHYKKAQADPSMAIKWCTGEERLSPSEPRTFKYSHDLEIQRLRRDRYVDKAKEFLKN